MKNVGFYSFLLALITVSFSVAQTSSDIEIKKVIPPTPNAASLGQYGNIPIGMYTGQANISLPLYEIAYNDFSVPIALSYGYSGLKVEDYPSWVGTGWTLLGTGVINRQTRSLPDESLHGYNGQNQTGSQAVVYNYNPNSTLYRTYLDGVRLGQKDSEPDMFTFSLPGLSGKFFFNEQQCGTTIKQATVLPNQNIKITGYFNYTGTYNYRPGIIEKFIIVDERGVRYTFEVLERAAGTEPGDPDEGDYANSWYLSSILTPNGNTVDYQYRFRIMDMPATVYEKRVIPLLYPSNVIFENLLTKQFTPSSTNEAVLQRITFRDGYVDFIEGETRLDWNPSSWSHRKHGTGHATEQPKTLSKVRVMVGGKLAKEIQFSYSYFGSNARLRLDSFKETNGIEFKQPYSFTYQDGLFPAIGSENSLYQQDHWGYYTAGYESTLLPPYSAKGTNHDGATIFINVPGNSREPVTSAAAVGILKTITYPTKGYTTFDYEANRYWGNVAGGFNLCSGDFESAGLARSTIVEGDANEIIYFTIAKRTCVKLTYSLSAPCVDGLAEIFLTSGGGQNVARHSIERKLTGPFYSDYGPGNGETFTLEPGEYYIKSNVINENTCGSSTTAQVSISKIVQSNSGFANLTAGGLRVSKVTDCADAQHCTTTNYQYHDVNYPTQSSGKLINEPVYQYNQTVVFDDGGDLGTGGVMFYNVSCSNLVANSEVPLATASGGVIGYKFVTVTEETNGAKGRTEYKFTAADEFPDEGSLAYPFVPRISNDWKRGSQKSRKTFNAPDGIINEQNTTYCLNQTVNSPRLLGFKPKKLKDSRSGQYILTLGDYQFESYSIPSGWSNVCTQQDIQYTYPAGVRIASTSSKSFFYENNVHLQMTRSETTDGKGEVLKTTLKYVDDVASIAGLTAQEISDIQSNPNKTAVIEKKEFRETSLLATTLNLYKGVLLQKVKFSTKNNPLEDFVLYNQYDAFGNVLNYTTSTGQNVSYQWGYSNKFPIVEVKNVPATDVFFMSFEEGGTPFADANGNNRAYSGSKVRSSGTYTIPSTFVPSSPANTEISYWYWQNNKWNFSGIIPFTSSITSTGTMLDEIRAFPKGSQMTTLTFDPAIGVTSVTDINSISSHYEYDGLGRLVTIRDYKSNILKTFKYNYKK